MTTHRTLMRGLVIAGVLSSGLLLTATPATAGNLELFCGPLRSAMARLEAAPPSGWRNFLLNQAIRLYNARCLAPGEPPAPPVGGGGVEV